MSHLALCRFYGTCILRYMYFVQEWYYGIMWLYYRHPQASVNQYPQVISSIHIWSIIDLQLLDSQQLIHVHRHSITCLQKLVQSRPTLDKVSIMFRSSVHRDVDWVSIECRLRVNQGNGSRVLINTRLWMPLVHMIHTKFVNLVAPGSYW